MQQYYMFKTSKLSIMDFYTIVLYCGILALLLLTFSFLSGLRVIKPKAKLRLHRKVGIVAFFLAAFHGILMLYFYFFT